MIEAAVDALGTMLDPMRLAWLALGTVLGLILGMLPGVGGVAGLALLLPFTFGMDPYAAFAFLLGLGAVTSTGDTIPAVLFGVPGTAGAQATVLDGHPMAQKGEAGRALAAAYTASLMGGVFGAVLLGLSIPVLRPVMLHVGSPELLAFAIFGISMVASLAGSTPLRGLTAAGIGILLSLIGSDPQSGTLRWSMDTLYLYDGLPLLPVALGIFALPELADIFIKRAAIAANASQDVSAGMLQGARDTLKNWRLVLRCSTLGAAIGAIPGLGSAVVDWFAYGHALRTVKGARETFGKGDVRGVIAPESANNAKEGGSLVPTIAFGVPGSASMAILLGAFLIHGLQPGPRMLTSNLDVTYAMVWSIAFANILGAGLCFMLSGQFAKISRLRYTLVLPLIMCVLYVGAFQGSRDWGDLYALLFFGVVGWIMKRLRWPRPPLILGFVLGAIIERYMFISTMRYGWEWVLHPIVLVILILSVLGLARPLIGDFLDRRRRSKGVRAPIHVSVMPADLLYVVFMAFAAVLLFATRGWSIEAALAPRIVGSITLAAALVGLLSQVLHRPSAEAGGVHMDVVSDFGTLAPRSIYARAGLFFAWLAAFMGAMALIGLIPTAFLFVTAFMRAERREPWPLTLSMAGGLTLFIFVVFDKFLRLPWPPTVLGEWVPALQVLPSI